MTRAGRGPLALTLCAALAAACGEASSSDEQAQASSGPASASVLRGSLAFERAGAAARSITLAELARQVGTREVQTDDPYYGKSKRFRALPLTAVLSQGFGQSADALRTESFVLRAQDGYTVTVAGARLIDARAFLAVDDLDVPGFAPIGPRGVSPAPAYLIWSGGDAQNLESHPRPWQLEAITIVDAQALYPHARPAGAAEGSPALRGFALFHERCIRCHAINREGGRVGPDLNVPQSIVEYRPESQIRAYIQNPLTFRYGSMPPNPDLSAADLDALIAYFRAMSAQKHDADARGNP